MLDPEAWERMFVHHKDGAAILEDLVARFHDRTIYVPGGIEAQRETERRAAQKEVVGYILRRIGQVKGDEE